MEECYERWWDKQIIAEYCWSIKRDLNNSEHDNQEIGIFTIVLMFTKVLFLLLVYQMT